MNLVRYAFLIFGFLGMVDLYGQGEKPNILLIYTDQHRYDALGVAGNAVIKTPNIDKLAELGVYFSHAFATSPVCMPSRWSIHTGMYTTSHQCYSNHHPGVVPSTSLPLELKKAGYENILIGKNHSFLNEKEFDSIIPTPDNGYQFSVKRMARQAAPWPVEEDPMHLMTSEAIDLIEDKNTNKPFFVWLSYLYPHTPYEVPEPYFSMYKNDDFPETKNEINSLMAAGKPFRQVFHQENNDRLLPFNQQEIRLMRQTYYGMVSLIDDEIARLLAYLDKNGLRENTLIIFTSDHGDYLGDHEMFTKSPALYDCLLRVPLIISWKGKIKSNLISDQLISQVDIMPTILSLLDLPIPDQVQGLDITDYLLSGQTEKPVREVVFAEYGIPGEPFNREKLEKMYPQYTQDPIDWAEGIPWEANPISLAGRFRMARTHSWKYVQNEGDVDELYDLKNDPDELVNLIDLPRHQLIQENLRKDLDVWKNNLPGIEKDQEDYVTPFIEKYLLKK